MQRNHLSRTAVALCTLAAMSSQATARWESSFRVEDAQVQIVSAGAGLYRQAGATIEIDVPGTNVGSFLYWNGFDTPPDLDPAVVVNGVEVPAVLLGSLSFTHPYMGDRAVYAYRAEVSELVVEGPQVLNISGIDLCTPNGVGLMVCYEPACATSALVEVRDGFDYTHVVRRPASLLSEFTIEPVEYDRSATLTLFVGNAERIVGGGESVWYMASEEPLPESIIGLGEEISRDEIRAVDGPRWDTLVLLAELPSGASRFGVQFEAPNTRPADALAISAVAAEVRGADLECPASVGDRVWWDWNADGIQDETEPGVEGVGVDLYNCGGGWLADTETDDRGLYNFGDLNPGEYKLVFALPENAEFTVADQGDDERDSDASPVDGATSCFELETDEDDTSWDAGVIFDCGECEGKVKHLALRYDGTSENAQVVVEQKKDHEIVFDSVVQPGEIFAFDGRDKNQTLGTEISVFIDADLNTKIHTSCSQPIGPGLKAGDFTVMNGTSREGGELCPVEGESGSGCDVGKPRSLGMIYTGEDCSASNHDQDPDKATCEGDPFFAQGVRIIAADKEDPNDSKAKIWFDGWVELDGAFDIDAQTQDEAHLKSNTYVFLWDSGDQLLQEVKFHTSCSQPLSVGNQFGSLLVDRFVPED